MKYKGKLKQEFRSHFENYNHIIDKADWEWPEWFDCVSAFIESHHPTTTDHKELEERAIDAINQHIGSMWGGLEMASIEHFLNTGAISGSFLMRLKEMLDQFAKSLQVGNRDLSDNEFCKLHTGYYGEVVDHIDQIALVSFTGRELKDYVESILNQSLKSEWVSVEERLPEELKLVLGATKNGKFMFVHWFKLIAGYICSNTGITHWMPLPQPPKQNQQNQRP